MTRPQRHRLPERYRYLESNREQADRLWFLIDYHFADYIFFDSWFDNLSRPKGDRYRQGVQALLAEIYGLEVQTMRCYFWGICNFIKGKDDGHPWFPGWADTKLKKLLEEEDHGG